MNGDEQRVVFSFLGITGMRGSQIPLTERWYHTEVSARSGDLISSLPLIDCSLGRLPI